MKNFNTAATKARAICVTNSWMRAWGVPVRLPRDPSEGDLVVGSLKVGVRSGRSGETEQVDVVLDASAVLSQDISKVMEQMYALTEAVGHGKPNAFRDPTGTRAKTEDYEGTSMRLTPFERSANPPLADILKWEPVVKREAQRAARRDSIRPLLQQMGLDWEDLRNIGLVFLVCWLHRHATAGSDKANGALLTHSLYLEFGRWASLTRRKLRSVSPRSAGLPVEMLVGSPCGNAQVVDQHGETEASYVFDIEKPFDPADIEPVFETEAEEARWERKKAMNEGRYRAAKQRAAQAALEDGLASMPHDRMVEALAGVIESQFMDVEAQEEADRRLYAHQKCCPLCPKPEPRRGDDEYAAVYNEMVAKGIISAGAVSVEADEEEAAA